MAGAAELLAAGWRFHQAGDLARAEQSYRQLVQAEPADPQGWYLLGALCQARGDLAAAADHLNQALRLQPSYPDALNHRGVVFIQQGWLIEAMTSFREALRLKPQDAEIQTNLALTLTHRGQRAEGVALLQAVRQEQPGYARAQSLLRQILAQQVGTGGRQWIASAEKSNAAGVTLLEQGNLDAAATRFRKALRLRSDFPEAYNNLGYTLASQGHLEEAIACYLQALRLRPDLADAYSNLGNAYRQRRRSAEAESSYRTALQLQPDVAELHHNLGLALLDQKRPVEAEASFRQAVQRKPELAEFHQNLGLALLDQDRLVEARDCFQHALQLQPALAQAHRSLGSALVQLGDFAEARACYAKALQIKPDYAEAHRDAGLLQLLLGDFERGLPEYEWRWRLPFFPYFPPRAFTQPRWDGSPLSGRTILLYAEQGLGDTLQFVRYARLLKEQGATVIVECQRPLLGLLAGCPGIEHRVAQGDRLPPHDVQAPLMSLPHHLGTRVETIPNTVPYLWAHSALVEKWRQELTPLSGFKVGIVWQGNSHYTHDRRRSIPLIEFAPLAQVQGVRLVSLQKGSGSEQIATVAGPWPVTNLSDRLDDTTGAFMDTAAVMMSLDLVVTVDTAIAHLAGALGVRVWLALAKAPHCTWLLEREDSPWYPTMRLFRQQQRGDWGSVFRRIARAVQQLANGER